jgi:hypothetical protein
VPVPLFKVRKTFAKVHSFPKTKPKTRIPLIVDSICISTVQLAVSPPLLMCYPNVVPIFLAFDHLSPVYSYDDFIKMMDWMPNIVEVVFEGKEVVEINELGHIEI